MTDVDSGCDRSDSPRPPDVPAALAAYEGPLLAYARRITGDADRARDVVQDTFLKLWQKPPDRSTDRLAQWLFTVCRNRALDVCRKERRMMLLSDQAGRWLPGAEPNPAEAAASAEAATRVADAMADLAPNQQEVLRLKFQHGFSYREIAGITGLSASNVGYLLHVGIKALRSKFQALGLLAGQGSSHHD